MKANNKQLPENWTISTIEDIAAVNPRLNKADIPDDLYVSFVPNRVHQGQLVGAGTEAPDHQPILRTLRAFKRRRINQFLPLSKGGSHPRRSCPP